MVRANFTSTDLCQISGIAAVITTDDDSQVKVGTIKERFNGVLTILRRATDGVECLVVIVNVRLSVTGNHCTAYQLTNLHRFRHQHGCLVS